MMAKYPLVSFKYPWRQRGARVKKLIESPSSTFYTFYYQL